MVEFILIIHVILDCALFKQLYPTMAQMAHFFISATSYNSEFWIPNSEFRILNSEFWILNFE